MRALKPTGWALVLLVLGLLSAIVSVFIAGIFHAGHRTIATVTIAGESWQVLDNRTLDDSLDTIIFCRNGEIVERNFPLYTPYSVDLPAKAEETAAWYKSFHRC